MASAAHHSCLDKISLADGLFLYLFKLTISEIHVNVVGTNVRSHGNNWDVRSLFADTDGCRYTIQVRHDDIHKDEIELRVTVDLVDRFQTVAL